MPIGIDCDLLNTSHSMSTSHSISHVTLSCWWLEQGSLEEVHCCLTTKYYSILQSITKHYKVLLRTSKHYSLLQTPLRTTKYYSVLHSTTKVLLLTNPLDSRSTWAVVYIARSHKSHPPTSRNITPTTKSDTPKYERKCMKTAETSLTVYYSFTLLFFYSTILWLHYSLTLVFFYSTILWLYYSLIYCSFTFFFDSTSLYSTLWLYHSFTLLFF